jgi:hypothetical protein
MNKRILIFAVVVLFIALIGFVLYNNLEIYEDKMFTSPSRDVINNNYYAMERWLNETGHPVRFEKKITPSKLAAVEEKVVIIHSSASMWDNAQDLILPWIKQGGYLMICLDNYGTSSIDENLSKFLSGFGITVGQGTVEDNNQVEIFSDESAQEEPIPDLGRNIHFLFDNNDEIFAIKDHNGNTRLVEISAGDGALIVTGRPYFMNNGFLYKEINARLAWQLTGARAEGSNTGVLIVRERHITKNMFGKIMEKGNLFPVVISAIFLIVLGFWMVIPVFGLVSVEKQRTSKPIRERFTAEIRFLKKYRALDHYLDVYGEQNPSSFCEKKKAYNYRELINQYRRMFNGTAKF